VIDADQRGHILELARGERTADWFDAADIPLWLSAMIALEDRASHLFTYCPNCLSPLLQTRAYAEATVHACDHPAPPASNSRAPPA
jgi:hypothetical protein